MNFLAHFFLGRSKEEYLLGNFMGDFVKGKDYEIYVPEIQKGILMHRDIDTFVDNHPSFIKTKRLLFDRYKHYAGVIVDIYYDYFLTKNWGRYSELNMFEFIEHSYNVLDKYQNVMPFSAQIALKHMRKGDWLTRSTSYEGLIKTFYGMSKYIKHDTGMENALDELLLHEELINEHFNEFFPEMITFIDKKYLS